MLLNAAKTKELIFDFRHCNISHVYFSPLYIDNSIVEMCDHFEYIGVTFDCKLKWSNQFTLIESKCKQRLFFLRLLNSFGVKNDIFHIFYTSEESKMYYGKQLSRIARLIFIYEIRYPVSCAIMQNAAVQEIVCTKLDTCDQ